MIKDIDMPMYQIKIAGALDPDWSSWLNGLTLNQESEQPPIMILTGPIIDQAKLRGILNQLWDLNLTILAVNRMG